MGVGCGINIGSSGLDRLSFKCLLDIETESLTRQVYKSER